MATITPESEYIVAARAKTGLTQKDFAVLMGISDRHLSALETGQSPANKRIIAKVDQAVLLSDYKKEAPSNTTEAELIRLFRLIAPEDQERVIGILRNLPRVKSTKLDQ